MSLKNATRLRRAAALILAGAFVALCYFALGRPLLEAHRGYDESIALLGRSLEHQRLIAQTELRIRQAIAERKRMDVARHHYLAERSATLASAELQGIVKRAIAQGTGELLSMQVVSAPQHDALREVTLRVRMRGDVGALQRMLHALEGGLPILFVNQLSIDAAAGGELLVSFDVSGQMRGRRE